jgi:sec-independent protein translocase protein TatA
MAAVAFNRMFFPIPELDLLGTFFGGWEIILILAILLILLGAKRLPDIARGLGDGLKHFRKTTDELSRGAGESLGGIYGKPAAQALSPENQTAELYDPAVFQNKQRASRRGRRKYFHRLFRFWRSVCRFVAERLRLKI